MAQETFVFNIAKGRVAEFVHRVKVNDPANSALILVPLSAGDTEANAQDADTLTDAIATAMNEAAGDWGRKTITDATAGFSDITVDDSGNLMPASLPSITWTAPTTNIVGLLVCYDADTTSGGDSNVTPLTSHVLNVTGDGNDVVLNAGIFFQAS
jgi:hypothetical protein